MTGATLIEVRRLSKSYHRGSETVHALRDVSFSLRPGEVVALFGRSGSGKSTLLNVLCGWEEPDEGEIAWSGNGGRTALADRLWAEIAIVPQTLGLVGELTVRENVELPLRLSGATGSRAKRRVLGLLSSLGLEALADRGPEEISIGEQQRTAVARALSLSPRLVLADEPTGHQDAGWASGVLQALREAAGEGTCCLIATHNSEAVPFADSILAIRDGRLEHQPR
jgi:ABC-type lipoprotein export system ATPase subunit